MGEYYVWCVGCYVWCYGMGGGFWFWVQVDFLWYYMLLCWFFWVWILQEFVLLNKLVFVVGMDMEGCIVMFVYKVYC